MLAGIAAGLFLLLAGGEVAWTRLSVRDTFREEARRWGIPPEWPDAIVGHESGWNASATNLTGPDAARGGAWGASQITLKTARNYGFTGSGTDLLDPRVAAWWTMKILATVRPRSMEDAAALWNAGRRADDPDLPEKTRTVYIPRVMAIYRAIA